MVREAEASGTARFVKDERRAATTETGGKELRGESGIQRQQCVNKNNHTHASREQVVTNISICEIQTQRRWQTLAAVSGSRHS